MKKYLYYIVAAIILSAALNTSCQKDDDKTPDSTLENIAVSLEAGDGKITLAPQTAASGYVFYYAHSGAEAAAPIYGTAIASISGATAYTMATDISGANGVPIYVQVYKVATAGNTVAGFGQANATPTAPFTGAGTSGSPYQIGTLAQLQEMRDLVNNDANSGHYRSAHYEQTAPINLAGIANWTPIGSTYDNPFRGVYDGGGFEISNLNIDTNEIYKGLFGYINHADAVVKNVRLTNVNISGGRVGCVVGRLVAGVVEYCRVSGTGNINGIGSVTGGVAGEIGAYATLRNCYVSGVTITSSGNIVGGVAGANDGGTVQNCYSTANVTGTNAIGGVVGSNSDGATVEYCYATGAVTATDGTSAGGIAGANAGTINRCVALNPSVTTSGSSADRIGRVTGYTEGSGLSNNYARQAGMTLTYGGTTYTPSVATAVHDGKDGLDVSAADTHGLTSNVWWRPAAQFGTMQWSATTWSFGNNRLPYLNGFDGDTQNPTP